MDNGYRSSSISGQSKTFSGGATAVEVPRESRIVENQLHAAQRMIEAANGVMNSMDDLRGRLLGISEPSAPPRDTSKIEAVRAELPELSVLLERLESQLSVMVGKLADLARI